MPKQIQSECRCKEAWCGCEMGMAERCSSGERCESKSACRCDEGCTCKAIASSVARSLDKLPLGSDESAVAWFYRVLRNAVVDHYRRAGTSDCALAALARDLDEHSEPDLDGRITATTPAC